MADTLVAGGAGVDAGSPDGRAPLMMAAAFNRADMVEWLLARGASPDARDSSGQRALDIARAMHADASVAVLAQADSGAH